MNDSSLSWVSRLRRLVSSSLRRMSLQEIDKYQAEKIASKIDRLVKASLSIGRCRQGAG
jgi:hypothetical protein